MRQAQALHIMLSGKSVFLTGPPGAGKTYVLNQYIRRAEAAGKTLAITASTGIAATHIGGTTIHSWSGLGIRDHLNQNDRQWLGSNDRLRKRYIATDVLIIDEVSMLHGARLDMVNEACKILRENDAPFGGLQVILVGDLFQLPPVNRLSDLADFAHTSAAWEELDPSICYLSEQHRQAGDELLDLLTAMRGGELDTVHLEALQSRLGVKPPADEPVTRLYTHNIDVDGINQRHLQALSAEGYTFAMQTKGAAAKVEQLARSVLAPEELTLKSGAEVMFVANDFAAGFVNGSRGQVIGFKDGMPLVKLTHGRIIKVEPHSWTLTEDDRKRAEVVQLPLRLAWAITIHKSQGMSLDAAEIDLSKSFTPGMGYVALSRVRSLDGVYLTGLNNMALQLHPDIYEFDRQLRQASATLEAVTPDAAEPTPEELASATPQVNEELLSALKAWRLDRARRDGVAPFMVAHNTVLEALAAHPPTSPGQLLGVKGMGPAKQQAYGEELMAVIASHVAVSEEATAQAPETPQDPLAETRMAIDRVNRRLLELLKERQDLTDQVAAIKAAHKLAPHQPEREAAMLRDLKHQAGELDLDEELVAALFQLIHDASVGRQTKNTKTK
ncbi:MAG TPA: HRDC domain-containing protein [Candidatus Saccharimonadales bacterium]|nr:HRDC domain-containing protein [Candidatus Saccharimonadales bacterium]